MILKTMDGVVIPLGDAEAGKIAQAISERKSHVLVRGALIPASSIALYPDEYWGERAKHGRLHDGTRVIREFGMWKDAMNPQVHLNPQHYPEIERDEVLTEAEWQKRGLDQLPPGDEREDAFRKAIAARANPAIESSDKKLIQ